MGNGPDNQMNRQNVFSRVIDSLSCVLFPEVCYFCGSLNDTKGSVICSKCRSSIRSILMPFCEICGLPLSKFDHCSDELFCGSCISRAPAYDRARYGVYYENDIRSAITKFKFHASLFNVRPIAECLIEAFNRHYADESIDVILPIPVHRKRLIERGFNQVITLSQKLSNATGIPIERTSLIKRKHTKPQVGLPRSKRILNLKNAFMVSKPEKISGKRVLIIDDVSTTGATVSEAAKAVRKAGAAYIAVLVLALRTRSEVNGAQSSGIDALKLERGL